MAQVAPVELPYNIKTLWFDPNGIDISNNDKVVVQTARGLELGTSVGGVIEVSDESVKALKGGIKPVIRIANDDDIARAEEMIERSNAAMPIFKEMAKQHNEDIHPVSVEFMLDGDKAIFYFEAEERVDFRELVRDLASHFHVRIDMRQIGVRDEARIVGGIAHCGQVVCCKRLGGEFKPVSIRMAKNQDLSLNPKKISGLCGRLMCCLRYEDDVYKEFKQLAPKVGATVITPDGDGKVVELNIPKKMVSVRVGEGNAIDVPLDSIVDISEDQKCCAINEEPWIDANEKANSVIFGGTDIFDFSTFTGEDKLGNAVAVHNEGLRSGNDDDAGSSKRRKPKRRKLAEQGGGPKEPGTKGSGSKGHQTQETPRERKPRRRSTKIQGDSTTTETFRSQDATIPKEQASNLSEPQPSNKGDSQSRKRRRSGSSKESSQSRKPRNDSNADPKKSARQAEGRLRPGHRSSGLAHGDVPTADGNLNASGSKNADGNESSEQGSGGARRRNRRRRSSKSDRES